MAELAEQVLHAKNRIKSRYAMARKLGYSASESGIMQSWSIIRIRQQAVRDGKLATVIEYDGKLATPTDVTDEGDN